MCAQQRPVRPVRFYAGGTEAYQLMHMLDLPATWSRFQSALLCGCVALTL